MLIVLWVWVDILRIFNGSWDFLDVRSIVMRFIAASSRFGGSYWPGMVGESKVDTNVYGNVRMKSMPNTNSITR